jgi:hypothetical protein
VSRPDVAYETKTAFDISLLRPEAQEDYFRVIAFHGEVSPAYWDIPSTGR